VPSAAAWTAIGVAEGDGEIPGDAPKVDGTDTVPASIGDIVTDGVGLGEGVAVETSTGGVVAVSLGVGVDVGESVGVGGCANNNAATKNAARLTPPTANCSFRMTKKERLGFGCAKVKAWIQSMLIHLLALPAKDRQSFAWQ
jgi:hypothetical protein